MRALWFSDAGAHTGFSRVTEAIGDRLVERGHDIHCLAINYRGDFWPTKVKLYNPTAYQQLDIYGRERYLDLVDEIEPDVLIFLNDPSIVVSHLFFNPHDVTRRLVQERMKRPIITYLPIDGYRYPTGYDILAEASSRVAMSRFGQMAMPGSTLIYHGIDTEMYQPMDKRDAKRELGFDVDRFLVLRVDKNSVRKNYADTWRALRPVLRKHDDIDVHFHCLPRTQDGVDIKAFVSSDEDIRDRLTFSTDLGGFVGWPEERMRLLYCAADLFVSTSMGEGFGLTIAEALACGTPVIASNVSAIPEVVGPGGIVIDANRPFTVGMGHEQMLPNVDRFTEEIKFLYLAGEKRQMLGRAGREHVQQSFSWDTAARQFDDLMTAVVNTTHPQEVARV